jgi:thymidine phosphorylase
VKYIVQNEFSASDAKWVRQSECTPNEDQAMKRVLLIALAVMTTSTAASASEAGRRDRIDAREAVQKYRIQQQRDRGNLTWYEKQRLNYEQYRIRQMEAYAKRDGYVSRYEARRINNAQNAAARDIYRQSHDGDVTWWKIW